MGDKHKDKGKDVHQHVHEFDGSVMLPDEPQEEPHNHRTAGVSNSAKCTPDHVHKLKTRTDFYEDHWHPIKVTTGGPIPVFDQHCVQIGHVHGVTGETEVVDDHDHPFKMEVKIENPIGEAPCMDPVKVKGK